MLQGRDVVPDHIKGTPIDAVRFDKTPQRRWEVSFECQSPNPYG